MRHIKDFKHSVKIKNDSKIPVSELGAWFRENGMGSCKNAGFSNVIENGVEESERCIYISKYEYIYFKFLTKEDAALFKLRWT